MVGICGFLCVWYGMCLVCACGVGMCAHVVSRVCTCVCVCAIIVHVCFCMCDAWGMWDGMRSEFVCMYMYMCEVCLVGVVSFCGHVCDVSVYVCSECNCVEGVYT